MTNTTVLPPWAIVELMGHRRLAGQVSEVDIAGAKMLRLDIPDADGFITQFYGGGSIYCITPVSEDAARIVAERTSTPRPVQPWELPSGDHDEDDDEDLDDYL